MVPASERTCHHFGLRPTYKWDVDASSFRLAESNAPRSNATVGLSSMAPIELPHALQKARLDQSEDRQAVGAPPGPTHATRSLGNSTQATVKAPVWRWHSLQEQVCGVDAGAAATKRMCPHRQPPSYIFFPAMANTQPCLCLCRCGILAASVGWRRRTGVKSEPEAYGSRCHQIATYRPCRRVTADTRLTDVIWVRALVHFERHALIHRDPETSTRSD